MSKKIIRKPNFFIVGARKSGTTALYHYLKMHPDVFLPELKEPQFFGKDLPHKKTRWNNDSKDIYNFLNGRGNGK